ncbi:MAG: NUDIX domain-containing protein [Candidatus Pacebacteria bacterium]|nr:NUDIX domain-containing protein [Candidatus Paceibacterota bacterium]
MLHSIIANALIVKDRKILISQRGSNEKHDPLKWTIPGGKVEQTQGNVWNILEETLKREIKEEVGLTIKDGVKLISNNTFIRTGGQHVIALVFICCWDSGIAKPCEDTNDVAWIEEKDLEFYDFSPNVKEYIKRGFQNIGI